MLDISRSLTAMSLCWAIFSASVAAQTLVLNSEPGEPLSNLEKTGFLDRIAAEAFGRCGLELALVKLPAPRGLSNANAGIEDGELIRIAGMEKLYPNLLPVPERMIELNFVAFSRDDSIRIDGWDSLAGYAVGFVRGWKIYEANVPEAVNKTLVNDGESLFGLLGKGRIDVALFSEYLGLEIVRRMRIENARVAGRPLAIREMFMYLNNRHRDRIPCISAALHAIKAEGFYGREMSRMKARLAETD